MQRPNETQFAAVERIIDTYTKIYGTGGTDQHRRRAALAAYAVLSGQLHGIPDEYHTAARPADIDLGETAPAPETAAPEVRKSVVATLADVNIALVENNERERMEIHVSQHAADELNIPVGVWLHESEIEDDDPVVSVEEIGEDEFEFNDDDAGDDAGDEDIDEEFGGEIEEMDRTAALSARTVKQLRSIASDCGVTIEHGAKKDEIIEAIVAADVDLDTFNASLNNHPVGV